MTLLIQLIENHEAGVATFAEMRSAQSGASAFDNDGRRPFPLVISPADSAV